MMLAGGTEGGLDIEAIQEEIAPLHKAGLQEGGLDKTEPAWTAHELNARVRMQLQLEPPETVTAYNVMWLLDGADAILARELVIQLY